jgi:DNA-binding phage protein
MSLSPQNLENLRRVVESRGLAAVARTLGVHRNSLAPVLVGRGRASTQTAIAHAFLERAAELVQS